MLEKDKQIEALTVANASLATEAGLWAAEPTNSLVTRLRSTALGLDAAAADLMRAAADQITLASEPTQVRPAAAYRTLADVARDDLRVSPRDWGSSTRNGLREAVNLFDLLAEGKAIKAAP